MAQYAIGSLAAMADLNPTRSSNGTLPELGYQLNVMWYYTLPLAFSIAGAHWLLIALMLWLAWPVVIGDDSNLVEARLLLDRAKRLNGKGSLLDGRCIATAIEESSMIGEEGGGGVVYGAEEVEGKWTLVLKENVKLLGELPGRRFPEGEYQ